LRILPEPLPASLGCADGRPNNVRPPSSEREVFDPEVNTLLGDVFEDVLKTLGLGWTR
jgi:hypothetical protein